MMSEPNSSRVADAPASNWVDAYAPAWARPYMRLARLDRPIGTWLLLWPCWWGISLASPGQPDLKLMLLFAIGAIAMRGAGCTYNDIVDRDFDGQVARTMSRPIPSGAVSVRGAWVFLAFQCLIGAAVLFSLNKLCIILGFASLALIAIYPFMKRFTYWPQFFLGLAFNWGALMGYAAVTNFLTPAPIVLYLGAICWTIGYDTIYAHQDRDDDALIRLKSTALKFGRRTRLWLTLFYALMVLGLLAAGVLSRMGLFYYAGVGLAALHLGWQIARLDIDNPARCLTIFRSNREFGLIVFLALVAGTFL